MFKVLIVEDDKELANLISDAFISEGFKVYLTSSVSQTYSFLVKTSNLDLIVLDLILPDGDGLDILKYLKTSSKFKKTLVIIISARGAELDRVLGLELGADDYVIKPFSIRELIIRVRNLLKKNKFVENSPKITIGPLTLDKERKIIYLEDKPLNLTPTEYKILETLIENPEKVMSKSELSETIWTFNREYYSRVIDVYICRIRDKLGKHGNMIETVRGFGYKLKRI